MRTFALLLLGLALFAGQLTGAVPAHAKNDMGMISVLDYGATNNGSTYDDSAFAAAIAAAVAAKAALAIPAGIYKLQKPVSVNGVNIVGAGSSSELWFPVSLGTGVAAVSVSNTLCPDAIVMLQDFKIVGPGAYELGTRTANCNGLAIIGAAKARIERVRTQGFDDGIVFDNTVGHIDMTGCRITDNYYGVYCMLNSSGYSITDCELDGNSFASIATAANQGFDDLNIANTHLGYGPYGIYQEPTPTNQGNSIFLQDCIVRHCRFENIGNAAIESDAENVPGNSSTFNDVVLEQVGFSWDLANYSMTSRSTAYAVDVPYSQGFVEIMSGAHPFETAPTGGVNTYNFGLQDADLVVIDNNTTLSQFTIGAGSTGTVTIGTGLVVTP
jgi:hypothetical protein